MRRLLLITVVMGASCLLSVGCEDDEARLREFASVAAPSVRDGLVTLFSGLFDGAVAAGLPDEAAAG